MTTLIWDPALNKLPTGYITQVRHTQLRFVFRSKMFRHGCVCFPLFFVPAGPFVSLFLSLLSEWPIYHNPHSITLSPHNNKCNIGLFTAISPRRENSVWALQKSKATRRMNHNTLEEAIDPRRLYSMVLWNSWEILCLSKRHGRRGI